MPFILICTLPINTRSSVSIEKVSDLTPEWEKLVSQISSLILSEQSSNQILKCREIFYKLLSHCVSSEAILEVIHVEKFFFS